MNCDFRLIWRKPFVPEVAVTLLCAKEISPELLVITTGISVLRPVS